MSASCGNITFARSVGRDTFDERDHELPYEVYSSIDIDDDEAIDLLCGAGLYSVSSCEPVGCASPDSYRYRGVVELLGSIAGRYRVEACDRIPLAAQRMADVVVFGAADDGSDLQWRPYLSGPCGAGRRRPDRKPAVALCRRPNLDRPHRLRPHARLRPEAGCGLPRHAPRIGRLTRGLSIQPAVIARPRAGRGRAGRCRSDKVPGRDDRREDRSGASNAVPVRERGLTGADTCVDPWPEPRGASPSRASSRRCQKRVGGRA